jgi:hypothetical protein
MSGGSLIAERLAAAGRQDHERITTVEDGTDGFALEWKEAVVAPHAPNGLVDELRLDDAASCRTRRRRVNVELLITPQHRRNDTDRGCADPGRTRQDPQPSRNQGGGVNPDFCLGSDTGIRKKTRLGFLTSLPYLLATPSLTAPESAYAGLQWCVGELAMSRDAEPAQAF